MDTGNMYPTNVRVNKISGRAHVFSLLKILGCQQMNEIERALLWRLFFSELFACQFELGTQPLTFENLLNNEKGIIQTYLPRFLDHLENSLAVIFDLYERESLSGLVIFRTNILPEFQRVFDDNQTPSVDRIMRSLNEWEKSCKKFILNGYSIGKFENINGRYLSSVTEEVKRLYPWWIKEYKEHDDLIDSIADEYDLTD